jgi:hypothetical protein
MNGKLPILILQISSIIYPSSEHLQQKEERQGETKNTSRSTVAEMGIKKVYWNHQNS